MVERVITTILVQYPWLSPAALSVTLVVGALAGRWLAARPRLTALLGFASLVPVLVLTLVPVSRDLVGGCVLEWSIPTPGRVELMANVVLFVPVAYLAGITTRRPILALVLGCGLSAGLELLQALVPAIGRSCSTNDWSSNTIGATIGAALAWAVLRWIGRNSTEAMVA